MPRSPRIKSLWLVLLCLAVAPSAAHAQSQITGRVADLTGGVLPGVTVEASSPALIEGARTAVTDNNGQYTITSLRPGTYKVTFNLTGFAPLVRDQVNLPSDFTQTINAELRVGSIEETVTVSGDSPIVDVKQTQRTEVMNRELIDTLPAGRDIHARGQLIAGVAGLDIGGTREMQQTHVSAHGMDNSNTSFVIDGMIVNTYSSGGVTQPYFGDQLAQEVSYQTSGVDAETSFGGVRVNIVPREGGNVFHGSFLSEGASHNMVGSNLTDRLIAQGATSGDKVVRLYDITGSAGGPIKRERLWFYTGARRSVGDTQVSGAFYPDGRPGIDDNLIKDYIVRLTWQATQKNKVTVFGDRIQKTRFHEFTAGDDPATASDLWRTKNNYVAQAKWTSTISTRLLAEAGYSRTYQFYTQWSEPGFERERPANVRGCYVTPCLEFDPAQAGSTADPWYRDVSKTDPLATVTRWNNTTLLLGKYPARHVVSAKLSYVTGSHSFKAGFQDSFGYQNFTGDGVGDLAGQNYRAGVPDSITVRATPALAKNTVNRDLGVYAQHSWTTQRLTLSPGIRFEWYNAEIPAMDVPAGRFVPARHFDSIPNLPDWFNITPRFGAAYDLFGNAKTAIKFNVGKYMESYGTDFTEKYNPVSTGVTDQRDWFDCYMDLGGRRCSGANPYGTNSDGIAQDWEIGPTGITNFGAIRVNNVDPDIRHPYFLQYSISVDHEVLPGLSVVGAWYRRDAKDLLVTNNVARSLGDYDAFQVQNPLPGYQDQLITIYNLKLAKLGAVQNLDTNATGADGRSSVYNGFEFSWNARLPHGGRVFGGLVTERTLDMNCNSRDNPNLFRFCDTTGGNGEADALAQVPNAGPPSGVRPKLPFRNQFKIAGSYPLPFDITTGASLRSEYGANLDGGSTNTSERIILWSVPVSAFQAAGLSRTQTVSIRLNPPGSIYYDRVNLLDLSFEKTVHLHKLGWKFGANIYNALNPDTVTTRENAFGATLGVPRGIILPRFWKVNTRLEW